MDLTKAALPSSVEAGGRHYPVKTWFKYWLCFLSECRRKDGERDFGFLFEGEIPENREEALAALAAFARPPNPLPRATGRQRETPAPVLDYDIDSDMLYAAFMQCYGIDLIDGTDREGRKIHWHKFLALCSNLRGTKLNEVMEARLYDENDKSTYDESRREMRDAWSLEGLSETESDREAEDRFNESFG